MPADNTKISMVSYPEYDDNAEEYKVIVGLKKPDGDVYFIIYSVEISDGNRDHNKALIKEPVEFIFSDGNLFFTPGQMMQISVMLLNDVNVSDQDWDPYSVYQRIRNAIPCIIPHAEAVSKEGLHGLEDSLKNRIESDAENKTIFMYKDNEICGIFAYEKFLTIPVLSPSISVPSDSVVIRAVGKPMMFAGDANIAQYCINVAYSDRGDVVEDAMHGDMIRKKVTILHIHFEVPPKVQICWLNRHIGSLNYMMDLTHNNIQDKVLHMVEKHIGPIQTSAEILGKVEVKYFKDMDEIGEQIDNGKSELANMLRSLHQRLNVCLTCGECSLLFPESMWFNEFGQPYYKY